jgi:anthranilate synthase component 1
VAACARRRREDWTPQAGDGSRAHPRPTPIAGLQARVAAHAPADVPELGPFWSGAVGYFGYDVVRHVERLGPPPPRAVAAPDALFVFTGALVVMDNLRAQARVVVAVPVAAGLDDAALRAAYDGAVAEIDGVLARLRTPRALPALDLDLDAAPAVGATRYARERFVADVERIKEYIRAGDCFQALLARRIAVPLDFEPAALLPRAARAQPSPYMYHLGARRRGARGVLAELLVRVAEGG